MDKYLSFKEKTMKIGLIVRPGQFGKEKQNSFNNIDYSSMVYIYYFEFFSLLKLFFSVAPIKIVFLNYKSFLPHLTMVMGPDNV